MILSESEWPAYTLPEITFTLSRFLTSPCKANNRANWKQASQPANQLSLSISLCTNFTNKEQSSMEIGKLSAAAGVAAVALALEDGNLTFLSSQWTEDAAIERSRFMLARGCPVSWPVSALRQMVFETLFSRLNGRPVSQTKAERVLDKQTKQLHSKWFPQRSPNDHAGRNIFPAVFARETGRAAQLVFARTVKLVPFRFVLFAFRFWSCTWRC